MTPGAYKIHRDAMGLQILIQIIPLGLPKWMRLGRSKFRWHVSGPTIEMSPRPSAVSHCVALIRR